MWTDEDGMWKQKNFNELNKKGFKYAPEIQVAGWQLVDILLKLWI